MRKSNNNIIANFDTNPERFKTKVKHELYRKAQEKIEKKKKEIGSLILRNKNNG